MPRPLIAVNNLTFQYESQAEPTLRGISLTIAEGEKVAVVGRSGCGKSTLINVLNSLAFTHFDGRVVEGSVSVAGLDPSSANLVDVSRRVGTVCRTRRLSSWA